MYDVHRPWRGGTYGWTASRSSKHCMNRATIRTCGAGTRQAAGINWGMALLAQRRFGVRTMFSAEPSTVPGCGALNFLATGNVSDGETAHDRQQPHDLTGLYERALRGPWK